MRTNFKVLLLLLAGAFLISCRLFLSEASPVELTLTPTTAAPAATAQPTRPQDTTTPTPAATPTPRPTATAAPTFTATPAAEEDFWIRLHPDGPLYVGDLVSFEVVAPAGENMEGRSVRIHSPEAGLELGPAEFSPFGIAGRSQVTLIWAWDTSGLEPGEYMLTYRVEPGEEAWNEPVTLLPQHLVPFPEPEAAWASVNSECCIIHYITGTEAERDLPLIIEQADQQARLAANQMGAEFSEPVVVTLLPRVLGHGGFASREISISYLDRNYAGSDFEMVLLHEMIHILDGQLGGDFRPSILVEGLAVYLSGGHFKIEPILPRAAALLELPQNGTSALTGSSFPSGPSLPASRDDWYIPLETLADDFYASQHEIGYLEGAALVEYMIERWGWEAFSAFYRGMRPPEDGGQSRALEAGLLEHFGLTLDELEQDFLNRLGQELVTGDHIEDVFLTVTFYDSVRRYQSLFDTSAYFRTAWLMDNEEMRRRGIVADYLRRPSAAENVSIELLLAAAQESFVAGEYFEAERYLQAVHMSLDILGEPTGELEVE